MNQVWLLREDRAVAKKFSNPVAYEHEAFFYQTYPKHTPQLLKLIPDELTIITRQCSILTHPPTPLMVKEIGWLLLGLVENGIHHRDVHPGNIVFDVDDHPRLIDWETAVIRSGVSYDFFGPVDVPVPTQHGGLIPQWWMSNDPGSIWAKWGYDIPAEILGELW